MQSTGGSHAERNIHQPVTNQYFRLLFGLLPNHHYNTGQSLSLPCFPPPPPRTQFLSSVGCLTSQQHASVSQGQICSDNFTCCHTEIQAADQFFCLTQSQYTDTDPTSPSADPLSPGTSQGRYWGANFEVAGMTRLGKIPSQAGFEPRVFRLNH